MTVDAFLWTAARLEPGYRFAPVTVPIDATRVKCWETIYGKIKGNIAPDGLISAGMMEAYIHAIQPRPQGNVHTGHKVSLTGARVALGQKLTYHVEVKAKVEKKGRHWVTFGVRAENETKEIMQGEIVAIWNA